MPNFDERKIKCPFFQTSAKQSISCEGITEDSIIKLIFTTQKRMKLHRQVFCGNRYQNCEIYSMLEEAYEE